LNEQAGNEDAHRLATQLFPFTGGSYARWFEGPNTLDMDNPFVLLELQHLKGRKELQQVVLLQIIARINHDMYLTKDRRKILIIDEAWELLDDPVMEKAMVAVYRKARKNKGAIIVVTQLIGDLAKSENSKAIIANSTWSFILKQKPSSGVVTLDPYAAYLMKTVQTIPGRFAEVMIFRGEQYGVFRNVTDPFTNVLFSTKGDEFDKVTDSINKGMTASEAINDYMRTMAA
jgi:conjugal transfer ATP-binding protein TraC